MFIKKNFAIISNLIFIGGTNFRLSLVEHAMFLLLCAAENVSGLFTGTNKLYVSGIGLAPVKYCLKGCG